MGKHRWGSKVGQRYMAAQFSASWPGEGEERDGAGTEEPDTGQASTRSARELRGQKRRSEARDQAAPPAPPPPVPDSGADGRLLGWVRAQDGSPEGPSGALGAGGA